MHNSTISLIAALSENRAIGKDNKLLWHIPEDLQRFKRITSGHPVIMGRKTFESIGRVLPNRTNIVITRDASFYHEGVVTASSLDDAIAQASEIDSSEIFIIGGGQIFGQAIDKADKLYLTIVHTITDGDAYFPDYSGFTHIVSQQEGESNGRRYTFLDLEKSS